MPNECNKEYPKCGEFVDKHKKVPLISFPKISRKSENAKRETDGRKTVHMKRVAAGIYVISIESQNNGVRKGL